MDVAVWAVSMALALGLGLLLLLITGVICTVYSDSVLPPGIQGPGKLRLIYAVQVTIAVLGNIVHSLGLGSGSQLAVIRYLRGKMLGTTHKKAAGLEITDEVFDGVPVRVYRPLQRAAGRRRGVLYFHGGGWVFGSINEYDHLCQYIARESGSVVVSVEYRLAPEHRYPAQLDDCLTATLHFIRTAADYTVDNSRIVVSGDSAGGNLTAAVCLRVSGLEQESPELPPLRAQVMIYPALQMVDFTLPSYRQNQCVPLLFRTRMAFFYLHYLNGEVSLGEEVVDGQHVPLELRAAYRKWINGDLIPDQFKAGGHRPSPPQTPDNEAVDLLKRSLEPTFSPLLASDAAISKMPPAYILTCQFDVLRDDGLLFKKRLEDNGVPVSWHHIPDGFHGIVSFFDNGYLTFPSGKLAVDNIVAFLKDI